MTSDGEIMACPECDYSDIQVRTPRNSWGESKGSGYFCPECEARFDDPIWREPHQKNSRQSTVGVARKLERMDADDL